MIEVEPRRRRRRTLTIASLWIVGLCVGLAFVGWQRYRARQEARRRALAQLEDARELLAEADALIPSGHDHGAEATRQQLESVLLRFQAARRAYRALLDEEGTRRHLEAHRNVIEAELWRIDGMLHDLAKDLGR